MHTKEEKMEAFGRLLDIMDDLREKCPWDREQTRESLRTNTIEETFELSEAILKDHPEEIKKELGDLLLHIVFYAKIGQEKGEYDIKDVCDALCEKLIYRHPHVYGTTDVQGSTHRVEQNWEQLKLKEKDGNRTVLDGVPTSLPALIKAYRMQDKARNVGFDWERRGTRSARSWASYAPSWIALTPMPPRRRWATSSSASSTPRASTASTRTTRWSARTPSSAVASTTSRRRPSAADMTLAEMDAIWDEAKRQGM